MRLSFPRYGLTAVLLIACLLSLRAFSAPWFDREQDFVQPDGSTVTLVLNGDEFYMEAETLDGFSVVRDPQSGWICYAELSADESELVSTGVPVDAGGQIASARTRKEHKQLSSGKIVAPKLKINVKSKLEKVKQKQKQLFGDEYEIVDGLAYPVDSAQQYSETIEEPGDDFYQPAQAAAGVLPPTKNVSRFTGTIKGLVLVFDFSDARASYTIQQYRDKVNKINAHYSNGNAASLRTFYEDVSRGVFLMDHFVYGIYRAPQTFAYYDNLNYGQGAHELMAMALNDMEANGFDFSQLTTFSSGEIRALAVMYTGNPKAWAEGMWYHAGGWSGFSADGVHTGRYCTDSANNLDPGTLIHEHGHMAAEWPDTYSYIGGEPGTWGVMGGGYCDLPNPYFLYENGWLDAENIMNVPGLKTMNSSDPHFAYCYYDPEQPTEFYMIRPYVRSLLYCPSIPDQGLTFWRIYTQGDNAQYPDRDRHIELVHANNTDTNKTSNVCFKEGGLLDYFSAFTIPSSNWKFGVKAGEPSGLDAADISAAGAQMTFILGTPPEPVPYYPLNGNFNDLSGSGLNAVGYNFVNPWSSQSFTGSYDNLGSCLAFDGVDDYVQCPAAAGATPEWTMAMWINAGKKADMIAADKFPTGSGGAGWSVRLTQSGQIAFTVGSQSNNSTLITPAPVYEPGRWTHVACTFADGTAKIFVNGALRMIRKGIAQTPSTAALNVMLARGVQLDTDLFFQGKMDDVRFYDVAMDSGPLSMLPGLNFKPDRSALAILQLEESAGTQAFDASGRSCHGTLKNGLTFDTGSTAGAVGQALSFDGVDDYIALNPAAVDKRNDGFTVALWAYPKAVHWWARFIDFGNGSSSDNILLARRESSNDLVFKVYNGAAAGAEIRAANAIELNKWQFFAAAVDSAGSVRIYKNGQLIQSGTTAAPKSIYRSNLFVGRSNWSSDAHYNGAMDDIRIYNCRLSDAEISEIYQNNRMDGPVPFSGADNVSPETVLTFLPALNAVRHDIYFGTEFGAVQSADTLSAEYRGRKTVTSFNPPLLEARREYFWRVDEVLADGTVQKGPVWRFSTIGSIQRQVWTGLPAGDTLSLLKNWADYPDRPSLVTSLDRFEIPSDWDNNYGTRVHGLLVPRTSGSYRFWIAGDNEVELWLGTSADPASAVRIAYISGTWSGPLNFDQIVTQRSAAQSLVANQAYYIMALHKEGDGGDHMAVAWQGPDSPTREVIDAFWLCPPRENESPAFDPSVTPALNAVEGQAFAAALPVGATDPDGQTPIYRRQTGPAWLHVAPDGQLSGTPENADAGVNTFTIRALDEKGGFDDMVVSVDVADRLTGTMGLTDLLGFAHQWLNADVDSPANLDQTTPVDFEDFALLSNNWNADFVDGLVAHWSMDEAAGLTARDSYADFDGTLTNMSEYNWVKGFLGNALAFDGKDDYVEIADYKGITGGASRTCAAWIKANSPSSQIMNWGSAETGAKWSVRVNEDGTLRAEVAGGYIYGTTSLLDGNWHHIAVVLVDDGSSNIDEAVLYVDGYRETEYGGVLSCPVNTIEGASAVIGTNITKSVFFSGLIDQVQVYDRALAADEIALLAGHDLLLSLRFDETQGLTCRDSSIYGRDGVLYGAVNPVRAPGYYNNAIELDGTDDYVEITDYMGISGGNDRACTAWIKTSDLGGQIISWGNTATGSKWLIRVNEQGQLRAEVQGGYISSSTVIADNSWHHIAVVLKNDGTPDISEAALYVDGRLETDTQWFSCPVNTASEETVKIGVFSLAANPNYYEGCIDDVRIYDRPLSAEDVNTIKNDL